ncbi:unnamed protein product [Bubo scandiacus]
MGDADKLGGGTPVTVLCPCSSDRSSMEPQGDADTPTPDTPRHPPAPPRGARRWGGGRGAVGEAAARPGGGDPRATGGDGGEQGTREGTRGGDAKGEAVGGDPRAAEDVGGDTRGTGDTGDDAKAEPARGGTGGGGTGGSWGHAASRQHPGPAGPRLAAGRGGRAVARVPPPARPRGGPPAAHIPRVPTRPPVVSPSVPHIPHSGCHRGLGGQREGCAGGGAAGPGAPGRPRPEGAGGRPRASARAQGRSAILEKFGGAATGPAPHLKRSGGTAAVKAMLLEWCRSRTRGYQHVEVQNFSGSWGSGLAFCALLHSFFPDAFDYGSLEPGARRHNFALAFATAEERAGCAPLLEVEDMVRLPVPDAKCVYTYLQELYRCLVAKGLVKTKKR